MVVLLTYFSLILGELVPKRLALTHPEAIASLIARPMDILATVGRPVVRLLSLSTDGILRLFGVRQTKQPGVTVDEIRVMLEQGAEEGVFEATEHEMVSNVLNLDERHVGGVSTARSFGATRIQYCRSATAGWTVCSDSCDPRSSSTRSWQGRRST
jgi:putative hemolysin